MRMLHHYNSCWQLLLYGSVSGQDESNPELWLATRAGKMELSCPLGTTRCVPEEKFPREPYNKSFIDQAYSVKMARYWPCSFYASLLTRKKRTWPISSHLDLTHLFSWVCGSNILLFWKACKRGGVKPLITTLLARALEFYLSAENVFQFIKSAGNSQVFSRRHRASSQCDSSGVAFAVFHMEWLSSL